MIDAALLKTTAENIRLIDLSSLLGICTGLIVRNDHFSEDALQEKIASLCHPRNPRAKTVRVIQKHTDRIVSANDDLSIPADGLFSQSPDDVLTIRTADCIPLFLSDGKTAALLHLGWRGIVGGIARNIGRAIPGLDHAKTIAVIGPAIRQCCFEVSPEVALIFESKYRIKRGDKYYIDLESMVKDELIKLGIKQVYGLDSCTYCEPETYYSYRREGEDVRHLLSFISLGGKL
jgi:YfiH family protein